ncbi:MAG: RNA-binding S4 domain-containing protein [Pseudomonadota bacterium]
MSGIGTDHQGAADRQRLDKWLWHARVVKTRTLAQKLVSGGKVRVNRQKILTPSAALKRSDVVTIALRSTVRVLKVLGFAERRGPASIAQSLFEDLSQPEQALPHGDVDRSPSSGNPTAPGDTPHPASRRMGRLGRRDWRKLQALKGFDRI